MKIAIRLSQPQLIFLPEESHIKANDVITLLLVGASQLFMLSFSGGMFNPQILSPFLSRLQRPFGSVLRHQNPACFGSKRRP